MLIAGTAFAAVVAFAPVAAAQPDSGEPGSFLPPGFPCLQNTVYPVPILNWGWTPLDGSEPKFVAGPPEASGAGSLDMALPPGAARVNYYQAGISTPLRDLAINPASLAFIHKGPYVAFHLRIRNAERPGDISGFTTLVWWPSANGGEGANSWVNSRNLANQQWWSTNEIAGLAGGQAATATLKQISDANPRAQVSAYGIQNDSGTGGADNVVYGCARWDFEPLPGGSGSGS
ncbi:hypothetical protein [Aldersonia kunmingensis]|uniref:hypothetical protein n=1 Tax=Aldersonia kunmingensis TaxID=408066 RepID=UPI001FE13D67|nr:hypothetical protein [Aldersonia kunmingensis]